MKLNKCWIEKRTDVPLACFILGAFAFVYVRLYIWRLTLLGAGKRKGGCCAYVGGRVCVLQNKRKVAPQFLKVLVFPERIKYVIYNFFSQKTENCRFFLETFDNVFKICFLRIFLLSIEYIFKQRCQTFYIQC